MTEALVEVKSLSSASPAKLRKCPASSTKSSKGKSTRKETKGGTSPKVPKKSTTTKSSTKKVEKLKTKKLLDSPMPTPVTEKKLKRKIDSSRSSKEAKEVTARSMQETSVPPQTNSSEEPKSPCRRNSPSQVSEFLSWEKKEHNKLFSTQSSVARKGTATATPPTPQPSETTKSSAPTPSPGKRIMAATTTLASQMNFMKPSTPFEADKPRIPTVSPDLKGSGTSKPRATLPSKQNMMAASASNASSATPLPPRSPKPSSTTPKQKPKRPAAALSPRQANVAPELNLIKRSTPFEVDAPRQVLRQQPTTRMISTDSLTSCDDGCMTEEQRVWKGIDSVLMDADSVSTTTSDNHIVKGATPGMYSSMRSRSGRGLKAHLNKRTPMTAGDMVSVASMEDVNSKSMLRAVRKNSMQASLNLSQAIAEALQEEDEDDRQPAADEASLPSLASLSTCNTSTSSNPMPTATAKLPSKLDRFMQKSKQGSSMRRDDGSMPSLASFRDDDFSQCSNSVMSMGMPSLCSIREDEAGSYRSQNDEDWRNGVSTIPEGNETLHDSPVKGKYGDLWAESPRKDDDLDQSVESLQLEDLLNPATPNPAKLTQKEAMKKRRSLSGAEPQQSKLRSFMSSFIGGDNESQRQTDILSVGSAGDIHTGNVTPSTIQRLHASDGCLLGTLPLEGSNNKSSRMNVSGNMSATDFSHFATENAKTGSANFEDGCPSTPSRHRRALLDRVSNSIAKIKSRVMTKGMLSPKPN